MKKTCLFLIVIVVLTAGLYSCHKEELAKGVFTATTEHFTNKNGKTLLDGRYYSWEVNSDLIKVLRRESSSNILKEGTYRATSVNSTTNAAVFSYEPITDEEDVTGTSYINSYYAVFPASIFSSTPANARCEINLPAHQYTDASGRLKNAPMYAESNETSRNLQFKNLCGIMRLSLTKNGTSISRIVVTTSANKINGKYNVAFSNGLPSLGNPGMTIVDSNHSIVLTCAEPQPINNGHDFDIAIPAGSYNTLEIKIYDDDHSAVCTKTLEQGTLQINRGEYTVIILNGNSENHELDFVIDRVLPGLFTVSSTGLQVRFSPGNLQWRRRGTHATADNNLTGTIGEWQFAENQWDHKYNSNTNTESHYNSSNTWVDLFRWGSSGYNNVYPYILYTVASSAPGIIARNNYDWGVFNAISNGGNAPGLWRTMTQSECLYLFSGRHDAANKWARATVHGVNGIILQPDIWIGGAPSVTISWGSNSTFTEVSNDDWTLLENSGAVFLPVTGFLRIDSWNVSNTSWGNYWLATTSDAESCYLRIKSDNLDYSSSNDRRYGYAVRLVRDAN